MTDEMRQARVNQNLLKQEGIGWHVGYGQTMNSTSMKIFLISFSLQQLSSFYAVRRPSGLAGLLRLLTEV